MSIQKRLSRLVLNTETLRLLQDETSEQILGARPAVTWGDNCRTQGQGCSLALGCTL